MAKLEIPEVALRIAAKLEAVGFEVNEEERNGQSYTRLTIGKHVADPGAFFQGAGAFVLLNLPGDSDKIVEAGADLIGLGNSSPSERSLAPSPT